MKIAIACLLVIAIVVGQPALAQGNPTAILPSATDAAIKDFDQPHQSWLPTATPRNQLVVFLPGTGGAPKRKFPFAKAATGLGYHFISLMYPDEVAAQQACIKSRDPDAYLKFRLAIIQGGSFPPRVNVQPADSIENRLTKLIVYLNKTQPNQNWGQFLTPEHSVNWQKIVVAGQSQGGGHAYVISKYHEVAKVIMFGSPKDYSHFFHAPAKGFDGNNKTPLGRYFAYNHVADTKGGCNYQDQMEIFNQMGLEKLGISKADNVANRFNHAHLIFTDAQLPDMSNVGAIHGCACNNEEVSGVVWQYLLTEPVR